MAPGLRKSRDTLWGTPRTWLMALLFLALFVPGCAGKITHAMVHELTTERTQKDLKKLRPDIEAAANEMAQGLVHGGLEALDEESRDREVSRLVDQFMGRVEEASRRAGYGLVDGTREPINLIIEGAIEDLTKEQTRRDVQRLAGGAARSASNGFMGGLDSGLRKMGPTVHELLETDVGPAVETMLIDDVGPGVQKILGEDVPAGLEQALKREALRLELQATVRGVSEEAVLGLNDGLDQIWEDGGDGEGGRPGLEERLRKVFNEGKKGLEKFLVWILVAAGVLLAGVASFAVWTHVQRQSAMRELADNVAALNLFTNACSHAEHSRSGAMDGYRDAIRELAKADQHRRGYGELQRFLAHNQGLKFGKTPRAQA